MANFQELKIEMSLHPADMDLNDNNPKWILGGKRLASNDEVVTL